MISKLGSNVVMGQQMKSSEILHVTFVTSEDWSRNRVVLQKAKECYRAFQKGTLYICAEKYGGNTLNRELCTSHTN